MNQTNNRAPKLSRRKPETIRAERKSKRLFSRGESIVAGKDIRAIWSRGGIRTLLMLVPLVAVLIIPVAAYLAISLLPAATEPSQAVTGFLSGKADNSKQVWMEAFTKLLCPLFYLCVPVMCGVVTASCAFVQEKEDHTLETLFLSALTGRGIFNAKITACCIFSLLISWVSFTVFSITVSILDLLLGAPFFLSLEWIMISLLLTPALVFFAVVFVSLHINRVQRVQEALQTGGYLLAPLAVAYLLQFAGVIYLGPLLLLAMIAVLAAAGVVMFNLSGRRFTAEVLFTKETLDRDPSVC